MYRIPYSKTYLEFTLPPGMRATVVESRLVPPLPDPVASIAEALAHPTGSPPLRDLARPGDTVCIVSPI